MVSVWVNEKTCPMCSSPDTVGGGVSIAYTSERSFERSNAYMPSSCQRRAHLSSRPSSDGRSGSALLPVSVMPPMLRAALVREQPRFDIDTPAVPAERAVGAQHPVAGHEQRRSVASAALRVAPRGSGPARERGERRVRDGLAGLDVPHDGPGVRHEGALGALLDRD